MATIDPSEAQANAQALADSFAQQQDAPGFAGAPGEEPAGVPDENPGKRKFDGEGEIAGAKRGSYNGPDTNGVSQTTVRP